MTLSVVFAVPLGGLLRAQKLAEKAEDNAGPSLVKAMEEHARSIRLSTSGAARCP